MIPSIKALEKARWGKRVRCAKCWSLNVKPINKSPWRKYHCDTCGVNFSVVSNTRFYRTHLNPDQILSLITLSMTGQLNRKPSDLCKIIGVHHWTMTQLIRKVKDTHIHYILNVPSIVVFESILIDLNMENKTLPYILFMYVYKMMSTDPIFLSCLTGLSMDEVQQALEKVHSCWLPGTEFIEEGSRGWCIWENWEKDIKSVALSIQLHEMCLTGKVLRNPQTGSYKKL